jgi:hypothetical protein
LNIWTLRSPKNKAGRQISTGRKLPMAHGAIYDCVTRTPMGDQHGTFTVTPSADGTSFTGVLAGELGSHEIADGRIENGRLLWTMELSRPMPMALTCEAILDGAILKGSARAGVFGRMPISGVRREG